MLDNPNKFLKFTLYNKETIERFIKIGTYLPNFTKNQKRYLRIRTESIIIKKGCFYQKVDENGGYKILFFPEDSEAKNKLIISEHNKAHVKSRKLYEKIALMAIGIIREEIENILDTCVNCQAENKIQIYDSIKPIVAKYTFYRFQMDLMCLTSYADVNNNYKYILVVIDYYTKYIWAFPLFGKHAEIIKMSLIFIFNYFLTPEILQSDNGKEIKNILLEEFCVEYNIVFAHGRPRKPITQGQVERSNGTLKSWMSRLLALGAQKIWFDKLDKVVLEYNTTIHRSHGKTPKMVMFGRSGYNTIGNYTILQDNISHLPEESIILPVDLEETRDKYINQMVRGAKKHSSGVKYSIGNEVLVKNDFDTNQKTRNKGFNSNHENKYTWLFQLKTMIR